MDVNEPPQDPSQLVDVRSKPKWYQGCFILLCCSAQLPAQAQLGMVLVPLEEIGQSLGTTDPGELSWMVASYGLTVGMFLIPAGRLGDICGPKRMWMTGYVIIAASALGSGFCETRIQFDILRGLAGLGVACSLPNAVALLGRAYPPGQVRSSIFAALGALAPIGFISGGTIGALFAVLVRPAWIWWFLAILTCLLLGAGTVLLPADPPARSIRSFDFVGLILLALSLGLFNFAWNQAPITGWSESYVWAILIVSAVFGLLFYSWAKYMGRQALIPIEVLQRTSLLVYLSLLLGWMSFGVFLFYTVNFIRHVRGSKNALLVAAQLSPIAPTGKHCVIAALLVPVLITRYRGDLIFLASMVAFFIGILLAAFTQEDGSYWALTFTSTIVVIFGPDLSFATGQLIVSNSVPFEFQGIAGGVVSMITNYSLSIGLGIAGTVERYIKGSTGTELEGYRAAFYTGVGMAALAVVIVATFVRLPKQTYHSEWISCSSEA